MVSFFIDLKTVFTFSKFFVFLDSAAICIRERCISYSINT